MDYEEYYYNAKSRYENACGQINTYENKIVDYESQKSRKINIINELKAELKNNKEALEQVGKIINNKDELDNKLNQVITDTDNADDCYSSMVKLSDVTNVKKISNAFEEEISKTKSNL
ncbi:MAG: She9 / Mdm33 family protein, partial [Oscillospiraceae bacterium]|nr:She9 / Mdm33 family protein [Oscillospiraceae bacterium]